MYVCVCTVQYSTVQYVGLLVASLVTLLIYSQDFGRCGNFYFYFFGGGGGGGGSLFGPLFGPLWTGE